jgi:hypothetical protein
MDNAKQICFHKVINKSLSCRLSFLILASSLLADDLSGKTQEARTRTGLRVVVYFAPFPELCSLNRRFRSVVIPV